MLNNPTDTNKELHNKKKMLLNMITKWPSYKKKVMYNIEQDPILTKKIMNNEALGQLNRIEITSLQPRRRKQT